MSPKDGSMGKLEYGKYTVNQTAQSPPITATSTPSQTASQEKGPPSKEKNGKDNAATTTTKRSLREKIRLVANNITVEPILAAYIMPSVLSNLATQNLNLEKACRVNMAYGDEVCDALTRRQTANYTL